MLHLNRILLFLLLITLSSYVKFVCVLFGEAQLKFTQQFKDDLRSRTKHKHKTMTMDLTINIIIKRRLSSKQLQPDLND